MIINFDAPIEFLMRYQELNAIRRAIQYVEKQIYT